MTLEVSFVLFYDRVYDFWAVWKVTNAICLDCRCGNAVYYLLLLLHTVICNAYWNNCQFNNSIYIALLRMLANCAGDYFLYPYIEKIWSNLIIFFVVLLLTYKNISKLVFTELHELRSARLCITLFFNLCCNLEPRHNMKC